MGKLLIRIISYSYYLLFLFVPLIFFPRNFELFEFNKMLLTYLITTIVVGTWLIRMFLFKKVIFRRTMLDLPLIIFLVTQTVSTFLSIDFRTSLLGYYSRFHGGLLSSVSYALLYWAYVSNITKTQSIKVIKILTFSASLVILYAILQHYGIDKKMWVQDVQTRVFSTLGQPNWLAAWLGALIPLFLAFYFRNKKSPYYLLFLIILSFAALLFTKSRSGIIASVISIVLFSGLIFQLQFQLLKISQTPKKIITLGILLIVLTLYFGTPWTNGIENKFVPKSTDTPKTIPPALETDRGDTVKIRKIVWDGALDIWKSYPVFGTGVETFAYSYYKFRPKEHNLMTEWDYLYNKAHNEYLNFLATTGTVGISSYLYLSITIIAAFIQTCFRKKQGQFNTHENSESQIISIGLLSGFITILITNFFGFSVVPVALFYFLFPAINVALNSDANEDNFSSITGNATSSTAVLLVIVGIFYILFQIIRYWYADYYFATGKLYKDAGDISQARKYISKAVSFSKNEAIFWDELAQIDSDLILILKNQTPEQVLQYSNTAITESNYAIRLSPANVNLYRNRANIYFKLSAIDPGFLNEAKNSLTQAVGLAPTEAKIHYNLGLAYARLGQIDQSIAILEKTVEMKRDYKEARYALAIMYEEAGQEESAIQQLEFIYSNIDPADTQVLQELNILKSKTDE